MNVEILVKILPNVIIIINILFGVKLVISLQDFGL